VTHDDPLNLLLRPHVVVAELLGGGFHGSEIGTGHGALLSMVSGTDIVMQAGEAVPL
jgi:hypothetical protein